MIHLFQFYPEVTFVCFEFMGHLGRVTGALMCKKILLPPVRENESAVQQLCMRTPKPAVTGVFDKV